MNWRLPRRILAAAAVWLLLLSAGPLASAVSAAPTPDTSIVVTRDFSVTTGTAWDITLPKSMAGRVQDQAWLVVDGHAEGLAGGNVPPPEWKRPLRLYANVNSDLDSRVKDILKAQGFPVKPNVIVYHVNYGTSVLGELTAPVTLTFRHIASVTVFNNDWIPSQARYQIGDHITLFSAVLLDSDTSDLKVFDPKHRAYPTLPRDLVHRITIEVQFLKTDPNGKILSR